MLPVTQTQIEEYNSDSVHKTLRLVFPDLLVTVPNTLIDGNSLELTETLFKGKHVEFVGCISSEFKINVINQYESFKNTPIEVYIKTDDTAEIPLFKGYVYSAKVKRANGKRTTEIVAYDALYTLGQKDVAEWYQNLTFPITLKNLRDSLFTYLEFTQETATLTNDNLVIQKQYDPTILKCLDVLKALCQINGCFGMINRSGNFEYRFIQQPQQGFDPIQNIFTYAKAVSCEDFYVKSFERVQIRDSEKDVGITVGEGSKWSNKYIIQANMFCYKLTDLQKTSVATNIYNVIKNIAFYPCSTDNNGLPFIEVGDRVKYSLASSHSDLPYTEFLCAERTLSGVQALRDKYKADGEEEASEYVTDLQTQIDTIKQSGGGGDMEDYYTKEEADERTEEIIAEKGQQFVSCSSLPYPVEENTVYLIQGDITIM